jgi:DNA-directed RNA polymerase specialized sigma24 family protein
VRLVPRPVAAGAAPLLRRPSPDLEALAWLAGAVKHAKAALALAVEGCRAQGYSDAEIGRALGVRKQTIQKRFRRQTTVVDRKPGVA